MGRSLYSSRALTAWQQARHAQDTRTRAAELAVTGCPVVYDMHKRCVSRDNNNPGVVHQTLTPSEMHGCPERPQPRQDTQASCMRSPATASPAVLRTTPVRPGVTHALCRGPGKPDPRTPPGRPQRRRAGCAPDCISTLRRQGLVFALRLRRRCQVKGRALARCMWVRTVLKPCVPTCASCGGRKSRASIQDSIGYHMWSHATISLRLL